MKLSHSQSVFFAQAGLTLAEVIIALAITAMTVAAITSGYIFCSNLSVKDALYLAANSRAQERMEQARSARWDTSSYPAVDQLLSSNFPDETVMLDRAASDTNVIMATLKTQIAPISTAPPFKKIRVDCIWNFRGNQVITNTIETIRAPDL